MQKNPASEKMLFLSLWGFIVFIVAVWAFWPTGRSHDYPPTPEVELAANIAPFFSSALVHPGDAYDFDVTFFLSPEANSKRDLSSSDMIVGVRLMGKDSVLEERRMPIQWKKNSQSVPARVPNPQRFRPKKLIFYLPH